MRASAVQKQLTFDPRQSAGVFVGISQFQDKRFAAIPYSVDDAVDLAHLFALELHLVDPRAVTLCLSGTPSKNESEDRLRELLLAGTQTATPTQSTVYETVFRRGKEAKPGGIFLTAIATHGFSDQGSDYLVAEDTVRRRIERTGIAVSELFDDISRSLAPRRLVLLDACRERLTADTRGDESVTMSSHFYREISEASGLVAICGTSVGGYCYDDSELGNGVFSAAIRDGLRGAASEAEAGLVTVQSLVEYVNGRILEWIAINRPEHRASSKGISWSVDGPASKMPISVDGNHLRRLAEYQEHRRRVLTTLRTGVGEVITGALFDKILQLLPENRLPDYRWMELVEEIDALEDTPRHQRSLLYLVDLLERRCAPEATEVQHSQEEQIEPADSRPFSAAKSGSDPTAGAERASAAESRADADNGEVAEELDPTEPQIPEKKGLNWAELFRDNWLGV